MKHFRQGTAIALLGVWLAGAMVSRAAAPASFAYVLQAEGLAKIRSLAVERLAACQRDWIVLDAVFSQQMPWTVEDLKTIRAGRDGRKVLAYLSIGEAEEYRPYWHKEWGTKGQLTAAAPHWLGAENPAWKGNYQVHYWHPEWQRLMLAAVDAAMAQGFDGIYLDLVDAFEHFEAEGARTVDDRVNPATQQTYRRDMVDWVKRIATQARKTRPGALVIPQNGAQLLVHPDFVTVVSGLGLEDTFTEGDKLQPHAHSDYVLGFLKPLRMAGKPVLAIEYPHSTPKQELVRRRAREEDFTWLLTDRQLKTLGESGR
ncbi:MAG: hypothetical protein EBS05_08570 [Proteobacteria bacterium]|nr:hypothetical protein [Pseudomonadota bacterium]